IEPESAKPLVEQFLALGYSLDRLRALDGEVPRLFVVRLPPDLTALQAGPERKRAFIKLMLPLILAANERIMADRARLIAVAEAMEAGEWIPEEDAGWLGALAGEYGTEPFDFA